MQTKSVDLNSISTKVDYGLTASATESDTGNRFLRITDIREGRINWEDVPYCQCSQEDEKKYELREGDIVFARTGSVGNSCPITEAPRGAVFASYLIRIRPKREVVDSVFLSYFFRTPDYWQQIMGAAVGAVHLGLNATKLKQLRIPLPPLPEQKRIAAILAKADRLRRLRRYARDLSDTYLQSVFLEMFGDPVANPMGWPIVKLSSIGRLDRGKSENRPRNAPELYGGPYPFVQTGDVANASGYIRAYKQTYSELGLKQSKLWPSGTLCITIAANIAKTAIMTFDACFPDSVVGFVPNEKTNVEFVQQWFAFIQGTLEETAPESAQKNINLRILRNLDIPLPPLLLQREFAHIVHKFERLRAQQREAERQAEHLFQTLLHRAFRGEL